MWVIITPFVCVNQYWTGTSFWMWKSLLRLCNSVVDVIFMEEDINLFLLYPIFQRWKDFGPHFGSFLLRQMSAQLWYRWRLIFNEIRLIPNALFIHLFIKFKSKKTVLIISSCQFTDSWIILFCETNLFINYMNVSYVLDYAKKYSVGANC